MNSLAFVKAHGTENDFVLLPSVPAEWLTASRVRALCDRRAGIGADGVIRVTRAADLGEPVPDGVEGSRWFMDYRNADGSVAEMCGNGARVFAAHLVRSGLHCPGVFHIGTRGGAREVTVHPDLGVTVAMGPAVPGVRSSAEVGGRTHPGVAVDVGNPHLVCPVETDIAELDLTVAPGFDPSVFPHGVNIEFINVLAPDRLRMRVHERGVGETRACGTGTVAASAAALRLAGEALGTVEVAVPGGRVTVEITESGSTLTGPTAFVGEGELDAGWLAAVGG